MNNQISPWPWTQTNRKAHGKNIAADPWKRLRDAIVCQAVVDLIDPPYNPRPTHWDLYTARLLLETNPQVLRELNIPAWKINYLSQWLDANGIAPEAAHVS